MRGTSGRLAAVSALLLSALAGQAAAQMSSPAAWQTVPGPEGTAIVASRWGDGTAIVVRCDQGVLTSFVGGTAPIAGPSAFVMAERRGDDPFGDYWRISANGLVAFARTPTAFVRMLRKGGTLDLVAKARTGADRETTVALPGDPAPLDAVLTACNLPIEAPDWGDGAIEWRRTTYDEAKSYYPPKALRDGVAGLVALDCKAMADGHIHDCLVVDETPAGESFGDYAVAMLEREMLVGLTPGSTGPLEGRRFITTIPFMVDSRHRHHPDRLPFQERIQAEALPLLAPTLPLPGQAPAS